MGQRLQISQCFKRLERRESNFISISKAKKMVKNEGSTRFENPIVLLIIDIIEYPGNIGNAMIKGRTVVTKS